MKTRLSACCAFLGLLLAAGLNRAADDYFIPSAKKDHWAWKTPARPDSPAVKDAAWVRNPIDAFVLAKLEAAGLKPAPQASAEQLIRRVTFDLIGLPPTPAEIDEFVNDRSPEAWEKVVNRLLASPHYGERWGRHWLDLARFSETNGYEFDEVRPDAWRYRDYVIASFNSDKPYSRFIQEQLAGDELYPNDPQALVATGFNLLGPDMTDSADQVQRRQNTLNDMTDTAGLVFLGMTLACARCHDHKFEPIPQADYYRLQAFFASAVFRKDLPIVPKEMMAKMETAMKDYSALIKGVQEEIAKLEEPHRKLLYERKLAKLSDEAQAAIRTPADQRTAAQKNVIQETSRLLVVSPAEIAAALSDDDKKRLQELQAELKKYDSKKPPALPVAMGMEEKVGPAPKTAILERGELSNPSDEVHPGFPIILVKDHKPDDAKVEPPRTKTSGRRTALADWMTHPQNPLTARVMVNRIWQHHFGKGIVNSPNDFGVKGDPPTHPELLDWLAAEFISPSPSGRGAGGEGTADGAWSIKKMHKLMLMSAAYRQSSQATPAALAKDRDNKLLSRMNRIRLEGEIVRDSLLAASGRLNPKLAGPGVFPPIPPEALQGSKGWATSKDQADHTRRSIYIFARRNLRFPFLEAFDLPDSNLSCPKREQSTTAPQALALLNSSDVVEASKALAGRLTKDAKTDDERIALAYRLVLGRKPKDAELTVSREFLKQSPLSELCRALFNVNEFVYLD